MDAQQPHNRTQAWLIVIGGVLAWIVVLVAVLLVVLRDDDPAAPEADADPIGAVPTLSAATVIPTCTTTLTVLPTATEPPPPTFTPTMIPILTATPVQMAPPAPAASPGVAEPSHEPTVAPTDALAVEAAPTIDPGEAEVEAVPAAGEGCAPPPGWEAHVVEQGDTLFAFVLGAGPEAGLTVDDLIAANCLGSRYLLVNQVLYLPPGAAENAPPSDPYVPPGSLGVPGPRTPNCPCVISIPEGWRREQLAEAVQNAETSFTGGDFLAVTAPGVMTAYDFVNQRPGDASMEGYLFPGTYTVHNDTTAEGFRDMLLAAFDAHVSAGMRADAAAQGVTFHQALTIASIVQREVRGPNTQLLTASVYYNNYRAGNRLGSTVTVQYAIGGPGAWWPRVVGSDLDNPSPFNTYKYTGLPPAPISSPGASAIVAAVYPPATNYFFHTAACDGSGEVFAETYAQHLAYVNCEAP